MDLHTVVRLALLYARLLACALACVLALHTVLSTDWRLLNARINARQLLHAHQRVVWVLGALWLSGGAIAVLDGLAQRQNDPELVAKIASTTCWLMAGFYRIARPLVAWTVLQNLALLGAALAVARPVALSLEGRLRDSRRARLRGPRQPLQTAPGALSVKPTANRKLSA